MKKILCFIITTITLISLFSFPVTAETNESFSGSRTLICSFDKSDVNNFVDGGLKSFKEILDKLKFDWCKIETESLKRDIRLTISFSFENISEYKAHMKELLSYDPVIICESGDNSIFAEGFESAEMLNFIQTQMLTEDILQELKFDSLLTVENCKLSLNGQEYETTSNFDIRKKGNPQFDNITITTKCNEQGGFERTIFAQNNKVKQKEIDAMLSYFNHTGNVENKSSNNQFNAELKFSAENEYELQEKTLYATGLTESKIETERININDVSVEVRHRIGIQNVLCEDGKYKYEYIFPEYYTEISGEQNNDLVIDGNKIIFSGQSGKFDYSYNRGLKLSFVKIETDIGGFSNVIKRTITFALPIKVTDLFDNQIKSYLSQSCSLSNKIEAEEKNEGENKLYIIKFSSRDVGEIENLTGKILSGEDELNIKRSILPFSKNYVRESVLINSIFEKMVPVSQIEQTYILLDKSTVTNSNNENYSYFDNIYTVTSGKNTSIDFEYKTTNKMVIYIILGFIVLLLLVAILLWVILVRKKEKKNEENN